MLFLSPPKMIHCPPFHCPSPRGDLDLNEVPMDRHRPHWWHVWNTLGQWNGHCAGRLVILDCAHSYYMYTQYVSSEFKSWLTHLFCWLLWSGPCLNLIERAGALENVSKGAQVSRAACQAVWKMVGNFKALLWAQKVMRSIWFGTVGSFEMAQFSVFALVSK